ncbi:MAG: beta-N-acetylglucosaminidase domain-containing protein [Alphaproteobacteria bacterium]
MNGRKVGELSGPAPQLSQRPRWFDATNAVHAGENVLAVQVACKSKSGVVAFNFEADVLLEHGGRKMWRSDGTWKCYAGLPSDDRWCKKGFDDSRWRLAREVGRKWGVPRAASSGRNTLPAPVQKIRADADLQFARIVDLQLQQSELNIVPRPHRLSLLSGEVVLSEGRKPVVTIALASDKQGERFAAQRLAKAIEQLTGSAPQVEALGKPKDSEVVLASGEVRSRWLAGLLKRNDIHISLLPPEGYAIVPFDERTRRGFLLVSKRDVGLLYAVYSFIQLFRKDGDKLVAQRTCIVDYPDMPVRGLIGYHWEDDVAWLSFYRFNRVFVITNISDPIAPEFSEFIAFLRGLGIEPVFYMHPAVDFCFSNPAHVQLLFEQMRAAREVGFREITVQCDDLPTTPTPQDAEVFGQGKLGLTRAHLHFIKAAHQKAKELNVRLYFCPLVYSPFGWKEQDEYLRIISDIPLEVQMFTTTRSVSWQKKLKRPWPMFWSNELLDRTYMNTYFFSEHPQVPKEQAKLLKGAWVMTHAFGINRANTLCFINNWWNLDAPLPLESALEREWGAQRARYLYRYAETIGVRTQWKSEMNIYSSKRLKPSQDTLRYLRDQAKRAAHAKELDWTGSGISKKVVAALRRSAGTIELLYNLFGDSLEKKLIQSGAMQGSKQRIAELESRVNSSMAELKKRGASDYVLRRLCKRWED